MRTDFIAPREDEIMAAHGTFVWNELMTSDLEKAKAFYAAALGWTFKEQPNPEGVYTLAFAADKERAVAGLFPWPKGQPGSDTWGAYIVVDDVDAFVAAAVAAGGTVCRPAWDIEHVGRIAIVADALGAVFGVMKPSSAGC
jgi:uncharacterized protein